MASMYLFTYLLSFAKEKKLIACDKRSPQSWSLGCYYACATCMLLAFVWTSAKNEWNDRNAVWSRVTGLSITRNWSCTFWLSVMWNFCKAQRWSKSVLTFVSDKKTVAWQASNELHWPMGYIVLILQRSKQLS